MSLFTRWAAHQNDSLAFRNTHVTLNHTMCTEGQREWLPVSERSAETSIQR